MVESDSMKVFKAYVEVLQQVDFLLQDKLAPSVSDIEQKEYTIIDFNSVLGKSANLTCLMATVSPVPQFSAR